MRHAPCATHLAPSDFPSGKKGDVLTVEFSLQAGGYATVVLRELVQTELLAGEASDD